jgi:hypothetical protein
VQGAWFVDILAEWGDGEQHHQQQRAFQLVMCFINMMVILGFSFVSECSVLYGYAGCQV